MTLPLNPYVAGNPVGDSAAFVGRADVLREVASVLHRPQDNAIVLFGQRRIGKTSILLQLKAHLHHTGMYPVYFDLQDKATWPLGRVLRNLARTVAHTFSRPDPDLGTNPETTFREEWLPATLDDLPDSASLVLLLDEFDVLDDPKARQATLDHFPYLRNLVARDPQRLQFVFVIDRNLNDLTNVALSLFRDKPTQRVSLLNREDTIDLVRLSEANNSLCWSNEAVDQVWKLTNGHPALTQHLCSEVWEQRCQNREHTVSPPTATAVDVNDAVLNTLESSRNTLEWLWAGLPLAERAVASALAEASPDFSTRSDLRLILYKSDVRVVARDLQNAPQFLQDWDIIESVDDGYRFRVELLRQWFVKHKPLCRIAGKRDNTHEGRVDVAVRSQKSARRRVKSTSTSNPFSYGNPISPNQFIDRRREIRRIVGRIASQGQSTAIVGEPLSGKTLLLIYLSEPEMQTKLYGESKDRLLFSYFDAQMLNDEFNQPQFWEYVLRPLHEKIVIDNPDSPLTQAYEICQENVFGTFVLERLLAQVRADGWRLVLLLDKFNHFLHHPNLGCAEFFGSLRSLASRSRGALALVTTSRHPLTDLNRATQEFNRTGSPYFNFLSEVTLRPWTDATVEELLHRARDRFTVDDQHFIKLVAGGHPYLLQVAAYELWDAYEDGEEKPHLRRWQAWEILLNEATQTLDNTWQIWSPATRQALTAVALADLPRLLEQREFDRKDIVRDLGDFGPELQSLKKQGFVTEDETIPGGWRVRPQVWLGWLADELVRAVRDETSFEKWVQKHELGFLLTRDRKEPLRKVAFAVGGLLKDTAEAAAKGAGAVIGKAMTGSV